MSSRTLKVGEMIKRALTSIIKEEILEPSLESISVICSEVRVTPDLKSAIIYILPMMGSTMTNVDFLTLMTSQAPKIRRLLCKKISMRYAPQLIFKIDETFAEADKLNQLINR